MTTMMTIVEKARSLYFVRTGELRRGSHAVATRLSSARMRRRRPIAPTIVRDMTLERRRTYLRGLMARKTLTGRALLKRITRAGLI